MGYTVVDGGERGAERAVEGSSSVSSGEVASSTRRGEGWRAWGGFGAALSPPASSVTGDNSLSSLFLLCGRRASIVAALPRLCQLQSGKASWRREGTAARRLLLSCSTKALFFLQVLQISSSPHHSSLSVSPRASHTTRTSRSVLRVRM